VPQLVRYAAEQGIPVFGVCLGLQGVVEAFGGELGVLDYPVHGKPSRIRHSGKGVFEGLPETFQVGRYHSLYARKEKLPECLEITAESEDGVIMGVRHRELPIEAVQFHPESMLTLEEQCGLRLMENVVRRYGRCAALRRARVSRAIVIGGGLAGMAAAVALERAGFQVELFEAHNRLGGRAGSFLPADRDQWMDRGQHILLGCCRNLLDFYRRLGVEDRIRFYDEIVFAEPGGRRSILRAVSESAPARAAAFLGLRFLRLQDKLGIVRALAAVRRDYRRAELLDSMTMADWLRQRRQAPRAIQRFWRPLVVSALNEEPDRVSALHGVQVLGLAFLASRDSARLGVPAVPLVELYAEHHWRRFPKVSFHTGMRVKHVQIEGERVDGIEAGGVMHRADVYILAVPAEAARALVPQLELAPLESSPITGIYLAFDRPVLDLPQSALLDRTIQWAFSRRKAARPRSWSAPRAACCARARGNRAPGRR
jgi:Anthranilate/para-aminobenzoate synthases component II